MKELYLIMLIPLAFLIVFHYLPMYGVTIAFKDFRISKGILGSQWNNFANFKKLFNDVFFARVLVNTLRISFLRVTLVFISPIVFSLLLNELFNTKFKKIVQTISYLPHFISWVVISMFIYTILSPQGGIINVVLERVLGLQPVFFMSKSVYFPWILTGGLIWQGVGWGSVIYLASIASIDPSLYDSAAIDGAKRFQKVLYITLPSIKPMIVILFILSLRTIMSGGFDPVWNLMNDAILDRADIIETYVFRVGLYDARYDYSAAVGLFQNVVGLMLVIITDQFAKRMGEQGVV